MRTLPTLNNAEVANLRCRTFSYFGASYELDSKTVHETYDKLRDPTYAAESLALQ